MTDKFITKEDVRFIYYSVKRVFEATGANDIHAHYVADAISFAHKMGKLNQGLGVYEALDIALDMGVLNIEAEPEITDQGATWATVNGNGSSGYWVLNMMADIAIEKARENGISIVFGGSHNDAGCFARYVYKAFEQDMMAFSSNNSVPLAAPFGGMINKLSCPPFDAIVPAGAENPIWISSALAEFYDADVSEAALQNKPLKGKWLIDPITGELSDDVSPYAQPIDGYGRVWDCSAAGQIESPRTYALNMWNEAMSAIINPMGVASTELPTVDEVVNGSNSQPTVGGSYYLCINPAVFGSINKVKQRSDNYVADIESTPPRPGHSVRVPSSNAYQFIKNEEIVVDVLKNHWEPFFVNIAGKYGLDEETLRNEFTKSLQ